MADLPVVLVFAKTPVRLRSLPAPEYETRELDCRHFKSDADLAAILASERPSVIVTFGERANYPNLQTARSDVQRIWLHFEGEPNPQKTETAGAMAFERFLENALNPAPESTPLVSVFTPTFRTGEKRLRRAYDSLLRQEYSHWEWVVVDDSDDNRRTLKVLDKLAEREPRIKLFPTHEHSGVIGELKRRACGLAAGEFLVELDHDDELTPNALTDIVQAFKKHPEVGFVYSDWADLYEETGEALRYQDGWAFGYGAYAEQEYSGKTIPVAQAAPINAETIRHIVGVPNHVRAWRAEEYWRCGGHNRDLHVADDYELLIRTFLNMRMARIPKLCYLQYQSGGQNTTDVRRGEIQRLVRYIAQHYDVKIHARLLELGLPDPAWIEDKGATFPFIGLPGARQEAHANLVVDGN